MDIAYATGFSPRTLRPVVCNTLKKRPNPGNWSEYPNIDNEIHNLIDDCEWYQVYDVIEGVYRAAGLTKGCSPGYVYGHWVRKKENDTYSNIMRQQSGSDEIQQIGK